ncbi:MAG: hypothetical protein ABIT58_08760, partial [Ferruginibacter sp.]
MKRFLALLLLLLVAFAVYWIVFKPKNKAGKTAKMTPIALKTHSAAFNTNVDKTIAAYLDIKNAFVEDDTLKAKESARLFINLLDSIPLQELKKDTAGIFETAQSN